MWENFFAKESKQDEFDLDYDEDDVDHYTYDEDDEDDEDHYTYDEDDEDDEDHYTYDEDDEDDEDHYTYDEEDEYDEDHYTYDEDDEKDEDDWYYDDVYSCSGGQALVMEEVTEKDVFTYRGGAKYTFLAEIILQNSILAVMNDDIYRYIQQEGRYELLTKTKMEDLIIIILQENLTKKQFDSLPTEKTISSITTKIRWLLKTKPKLPGFNLNPKMMNFKNGVLYMKSAVEFQLLPHTPNTHFDYTLNGNYIFPEERGKAKTFEKFCQTSLAGDKEKCLLFLQMLGYILADDVDGKCFFIFYGKSNTGKSKLLEFIESIIPEDNRTNVGLDELSNQFNLAQLKGKKLNIQDELPVKCSFRDDYVKAITSGSSMLAARKNQDPFSFKPLCTMLIATNVIPQLKSDVSGAFSDRMKVLVFSQSVSKQERDPNLLQGLIAEKDIIISLAVDAYAQLAKNNYKFAEPADSWRFLEAYKNQGNTVSLFITDELVIHPDARVHSKTVNTRYNDFCEENGLEIQPAKILKDTLRMIDGVIESRFTYQGKNLRGYKGVGLKTDFYYLLEEKSNEQKES